MPSEGVNSNQIDSMPRKPVKNPVAKELRTPKFRTRKVAARKGVKAYQRKPKHPREPGDENNS